MVKLKKIYTYYRDLISPTDLYNRIVHLLIFFGFGL